MFYLKNFFLQFCLSVSYKYSVRICRLFKAQCAIESPWFIFGTFCLHLPDTITGTNVFFHFSRFSSALISTKMTCTKWAEIRWSRTHEEGVKTSLYMINVRETRRRSKKNKSPTYNRAYVCINGTNIRNRLLRRMCTHIGGTWVDRHPRQHQLQAKINN